MVPPGRFELPIPSLGEKCSSPELRGPARGAAASHHRLAAAGPSSTLAHASAERLEPASRRLANIENGRGPALARWPSTTLSTSESSTGHPAYCCDDHDRPGTRPGA